MIIFFQAYSSFESEESNRLSCKFDERKIVRRNGDVICRPCKICPAGFGLSPPCYHLLPKVEPFEEKCVPCVLGETYPQETIPLVADNAVIARCMFCLKSDALEVTKLNVLWNVKNLIIIEMDIV